MRPRGSGRCETGSDGDTRPVRLGGRVGRSAASPRGSRTRKPPRPGDGLGGVLESPACDLEAHPLDVAGRGDADLGAECASEMARAQVGTRRHRLDGVIVRWLLEHEPQGFPQGLTVGLLRREGGAEL